MALALVKLVAGLLWLGSTVLLASTDVHDHRPLRIVAAFIVGIPGALAFVSGIGDLVGRPKQVVRNRVKRTLQTSLNEIYRSELYPGDVTHLSFHVWVLPAYLRFLPEWTRHAPAGDHQRMPMFLRARLRRLAMFRWEHLAPSRVRFRKGVGIIGRCVDENKQGKPMHVRLDSSQFQKALREGKERWKHQPLNITQNLKFDNAQKLAQAYGQVAAVVLQETSGVAIGCITLDLPPGAPVNLRKASGKPLLNALLAAAKHVENHLTQKNVDA